MRQKKTKKNMIDRRVTRNSSANHDTNINASDSDE